MESIEKVRKMLERFYLGETTLEEEKWLQGYFSSNSVPEELLTDRELFSTFSAADESIHVPADLNSRILDTIDHAERKELKARRISLYALSGMAAGILAIVAVYVFFLRTDQPAMLAGNQVDTYQDPIAAYDEAKRALSYMSVKLNDGTSELRHVQQVSKTTTDPLKSLSKINKGTRELVLLGQLQRVREIDN
jgi:hypothetical protein